MASETPKKVLYIDYFFPPLEADWRAIAFAKHMPGMGWHPVVVSAAETVSYGKDYSTLEGISPEVSVHRIGHRERSKTWNYVRIMLRMATDFPDTYKTWYGPAYRVARKIIQSEKIDLIYSASPTFTTAMVAMALKEEFNIPWVADFLDGWAVNDFLMDYLKRYLAAPMRQVLLWRIRNAEQAILTTADHVVSIHYHVVERWKKLHGVRGDNIHVVTDGYEEEVFCGLSPRFLSFAKIKIMFMGSYYYQFHDTIRNFLRAIYDIEPEAEIIFIGRNLDAVHQMRIPNTICMLNLPRRKAFEYALASDFLYVVMPAYAHWTPTKTYDYLRLGKPILGSVPTDGDAAMHITKARAGYVLPYGIEAMKAQLRDIFAQYKSGILKDFAPNQDYIAQFERNRLTERMVTIFNSALKERV